MNSEKNPYSPVQEENRDLESVPTYQLVQEIQKKEGVGAKYIPPHEVFKIEVEGPAILLIVTD